MVPMQFARRSQRLFPLSFRRKLNHRGHRGRALTIENHRLTDESAGVTKPSDGQAWASSGQTLTSDHRALASATQALRIGGQALTSRDQTLASDGRALQVGSQALRPGREASTFGRRALGFGAQACGAGRGEWGLVSRERASEGYATKPCVMTLTKSFRPFRATNRFWNIRPWAMPTAITSHACSVMRIGSMNMNSVMTSTAIQFQAAA